MSPGCGTTRWTDTKRTATEQLLISDAVDRAVQKIDFSPIKDEKVFFDSSGLRSVVDDDYVISSIRQHLLASGCRLAEKKEDAVFVVEARAGAVGTDRHDVLYGIPATTVPTVVNIPGVPSQIPEVPIAKRTNQLGVAKIAVFAYERATGAPVWQSGMASQTSRAKDIWLLGAGPFQKGTIYNGTAFAGQVLKNPLNPWSAVAKEDSQKGVPLTAKAVFPRSKVARAPKEAMQTSHNQPGDGSLAVAENKSSEKAKQPAPQMRQEPLTQQANSPPDKTSTPEQARVNPQPADTPRLTLLPPIVPYWPGPSSNLPPTAPFTPTSPSRSDGGQFGL